MVDTIPVLDSGSLSESFNAITPTSTDVPATLLYEMLSEALREDDQDALNGGTQLLERFLMRPEELRDRLAQKTHRLKFLKRYDLVPDPIVDYLLEHVGFGPGSGAAYEVARALPTYLKRRLVKIAVLFWKRRGTLRGLSDAIRFVTGRRAIIDTWHDLRLVAGETPIGGFLPPPASLSSICFPAPSTLFDPAPAIGGTTYPDPADLAEYESRVFITSNGDEDLDELVYDLCTLSRPAGECIQIVYGLYGDQFLDGLGSSWTALEGTRPTWLAPFSQGKSGTARLPGLRFSSGVTREAVALDGSESWSNYIVRAWIRPCGPDVLRIVTIYAHSSKSATRASGVGAMINWADKTVTAVSKTASDLNNTEWDVATVHVYPDTMATYCLELQVTNIDSTYSQVRVYFDHELVIDDVVEHFGQTDGPPELYSDEQTYWDLVRFEVESKASTVRRIYPAIYDT